MSEEYSKLICQLLEAAKGDDRMLSKTEVEGLVTQIKSAAENAYPDYNLMFPADDSPVVDEIMNGNYGIAGRLLAAPNGGLVEGINLMKIRERYMGRY